MNDIEETAEFVQVKKGTPLHYYGDIVRKLFLISATIMIVTLPFLSDRILVPSFISIFTIMIVTAIAGFINPEGRSILILDFIIAIGGVIVFETIAVNSYTRVSPFELFFVVNQVLAILFLSALYYSAKTLRTVIPRKFTTGGFSS